MKHIQKQTKVKFNELELNCIYSTILGDARLIKFDFDDEEHQLFLDSYAWTNYVSQEAKICIKHIFSKIDEAKYFLIFSNNYIVPVFNIEEYARIRIDEKDFIGKHNFKKINEEELNELWSKEINEFVYYQFSFILKQNPRTPKTYENIDILNPIKDLLARITNYYENITDIELINLFDLKSQHAMIDNQINESSSFFNYEFNKVADKQLNFNNIFSCYKKKFLLFFHNNESIFYYLLKGYCKKNASKIIKINNLEGDVISQNYIAVFDKIPDDLLIFYSDPTISEEINKHSSRYTYNHALIPYNDNFFENFPFKNYIKQICEETGNIDSFLDCLGFSYLGKGIRKINNVLNTRAIGYLNLNENNDYFNIKKFDLNTKFPLSTTELEFLLLTDNFNPYFLNSIMIELRDFYGSETFTYKKITELYNKYLAIGLEDSTMKIPKKWISEFKLYILIRKHYPDTIFQYKCSWLENQSIDIYIPSINTGIEYQGIQHFKSVDHFGGQEGLEKRKKLDLIKANKCKKNGVKLIYWNYDEEIKYEIFKDKLNALKIIS